MLSLLIANASRGLALAFVTQYQAEHSRPRRLVPP